LATAERRGAALIMSPADHVYLDMKYEAGYPLGLDWAGHVDVRDAYDWDPAEIVGARTAVLGIEAPLWTETITTVADIERMLLPRLPAIAERAWSPAESRDWGRFRARLGGHASVWDRLGMAYHPSLQVAWPSREFAAGHQGIGGTRATRGASCQTARETVGTGGPAGLWSSHAQLTPGEVNAGPRSMSVVSSARAA
jgi:N-acetyl-beta-hexosaminidase